MAKKKTGSEGLRKSNIRRLPIKPKNKKGIIAGGGPVNRFKFSRKMAMVFMVVFVVIGGYIVWSSFAATITILSLEAENISPLPAGVANVADGTASGGHALRYSSNATASTSVLLAQPATGLVVKAKGTCAKNNSGIRVTIDGTQVISSSVSTNWTNVGGNTSLAAGIHTLGIGFTNDGSRKGCNRDLLVDIVTFSGSDVAATDPTPTPVKSVWASDAEEGSLADWYYPSTSATGDYGGGEYNSGTGHSVATNEIAHGSSWANKLILDNGIGGTRLFRWKELRANRQTTQSAWIYIPKNYTLTGDPNTGKYWILYEFKSRTADNAHNDPFWYVNAYNKTDGSLGAKLAWGYQSRLEGPHQGESGWRNYGDVSVPVGRWFKVESTLTQSKDFDGSINVTLDGQQLASVTNIRTGWPNCTFNPWCVDQGWAITNYSDGISQAPSIIYADDSEIKIP